MLEIQEVRDGVVCWTREEDGVRLSGQHVDTNYSRVLWTMLDPETDWPTLPEDINPEPGGPEAYFAGCIRENVAHARSQLAQLEEALGRPGWFEVEQQAFDALHEAMVGIEVAVTGRVMLGHADIADRTPTAGLF